MKRVVVVGGGIAGLTAAYLLGEDPDRDVVVLEGSPQLGGKLRLATVAGVTVDVGAEAMLNRRPEGAALARELDLPVVHPVATRSQLWTRDALRPLPRSLMGVPLDVEELAASGVLSAAGLRRVRAEPSLPPTELDGDDISVGDLVANRLGDEVVDRLVEPLLGGVYAGHARLLSARAATPQLVAMLDRGSLLEAAAAAVPVSTTPVFAGVPGGLGELPRALLASDRFAARTDATVRELRKAGEGYELVVGSAHRPELVKADEVVLAVPATPAGRLLADVSPLAAAELATIEYASTAVITLAFRAQGFPIAEGSSGFLVPPLEGRRIKASTFSFAKWSWIRTAGRGALDGDHVLLLRTSLGRHREEASLQATDEELVAASLADLAEAIGLTSPSVDVHVQRWGGGLPQYAVGHLDRVARIRGEVARLPGLAVCGAAYDGVGIPAVIASARRAADEVRAAE
ncbi:MAG TPA: protoporphyrinogen oxidase [Nocardioides sp.]|nr:protoporphyrinogen oxidase [Nocardioides sp.]